MDKEAQTRANTILQQLGGTRFVAMTGAKDFSIIENGLQFKLPNNFAKNGINCVRVVLTSKDLYDVEYGLIKNFEYSVVNKDTDLYNDQLQNSFRTNTGLEVSL
jgi:hypothetical protein